MSSKRQAAIDQAQDGLTKMQQSVDTLKANGIDPAALTVVSDGQSKPLTTVLSEMKSKVASMSQQFDAAIAQLDQKEKDAAAQIVAN